MRVIRVVQKARRAVVLQFAHGIAPMSSTGELKLDRRQCHSARTTPSSVAGAVGDLPQPAYLCSGEGSPPRSVDGLSCA